MISFEESVKDIVGLTSFELGKLPAWMKMRVLSFHGASVDEAMTDAEVVEKFVREAWLGHWGVATINGQEVGVLEHLDVNHQDVIEAAALANRLQCGFVVVELDDAYEGGCTTYLTEDYCFAARNH